MTAVRVNKMYACIHFVIYSNTKFTNRAVLVKTASCPDRHMSSLNLQSCFKIIQYEHHVNILDHGLTGRRQAFKLKHSVVC